MKPLKLEGHRDRVVPIHKFLGRTFKYALLAGILIFISVAIGTFGYHEFAALDYLDSFHMSCMILTGMGPTNPMVSSQAKIFSSFYALYSGIAFLSTTAVYFAPIIHRILHILHVEDNRYS